MPSKLPILTPVAISSILSLLLLLAPINKALFAQTPPNDECTGALTVTASIDYACSNPITTTLENSTFSDVPSQCLSSIFSEERDIWLKFTAVSTRHIVEISSPSISISYNLRAAVFEANSCMEIDYSNEIFCYEYRGEQIKFRDLNIGQDYYIILKEENSPQNNDDLTVCVYSFPEEDCLDNTAGVCNSGGQIIDTLPPNAIDDGYKIADVDQSENFIASGHFASGANSSVVFNFYKKETFGTIPVGTVSYPSTAASAQVAADGDFIATSIISGNLANQVQIYCWNGSTFEVCDSISKPNQQSNPEFGRDLDMHQDRLVIGAPGTHMGNNFRVGEAHVYRRQGNDWQLEATLADPNGMAEDKFGGTVSIYGDFIAVGQNSGANQKIHPKVFIFKRSGTNWNLHQVIENCDGHPNDGFGIGIDIDQYNMVITAFTHQAGGSVHDDVGRAYHFQIENDAWIQKNILLASDEQASSRFGGDVDMHDDKIIVGCPWFSVMGSNNYSSGKGYLFEIEGECVEEIGQLIYIDSTNVQLGQQVSLHSGWASLGAPGSNKIVHYFIPSTNCATDQYFTGSIDYDVDEYAHNSILIDAQLEKPAQGMIFTAGNSIELEYPFEIEDSIYMSLEIEKRECNCNDDIDNDNDGSIDCADSDCAQDPDCSSYQANLDSLILVDLYNSTDGPNWLSLWNLQEPMDSWLGVSLNPARRVIGIHLHENGLLGVLPQSIGDLSELTYLILSANMISGPIPGSVTSLTKLRNFNLHSNQLDGSLPSDLGSMVELTDFSVHDNNMHGIIPSSIGNLSNLIRLGLGVNHFTSLPDEITQCTELITLVFQNNDISTPLPASIGNLSKLVSLNANNNPLGGSIPSSFTQLSELEYAHLVNCDLNGQLPSDLGNLTKLKYFSVYDNNLDGDIPTSIGNFEEVIVLGFGANNFSSLPASLSLCTTLEELHIQANNFNQSLPGSYQALSNLRIIRANSCQLTGAIPDIFSNLTMLEELNLYDNNLSGSIPASLDQFCNLQVVSLGSNPNLEFGGNFEDYCDSL